MARSLNDPKDPMGTNIVHILLETFNRVQSIPAVILSGIIFLLGGVVYLVWNVFQPGDVALLVSAVFVIGSLVDWLLLWLLPRLGLSYGPDRPSTLALAVVRLWLMLFLGVLSAVWWMAVIVSLLVSATVFYSTYIAPFQLGVTHESLAFPGWKADTPPLRVLHIADIHVEFITKRERRLNALIKELTPDVIVFSGDFVNISYNQDSTTAQHIRQVIGEWSAPYGVYCVQGTYTVEPMERVRYFVNGLDNLRLLDNEWVCMETLAGKLNILGMTTTHKTEKDRVTVQKLAQNAPNEGFRLLVTHAPDVAPEADTAGYNLYVCGHTHGGQLRFPIIGAVFSGSALGNRFVMGRYDLEQMTLYTSRGVGLEGMSAPRARFLCPPEIILWELHGTA